MTEDSINKILLLPNPELKYYLYTNEISMFGAKQKLMKMSALIDEKTVQLV